MEEDNRDKTRNAHNWDIDNYILILNSKAYISDSTEVC